MIRVAITGAGSPEAGELIRLLVNHPDVEILWLHDLRHTGKSAESVHHGLIGETPLSFSLNPSWDKVKLLITTDPKFPIPSHDELPNLKVIDMSGTDPVEVEAVDKSRTQPIAQEDTELIPQNGWALGLGELNRKTLVRGATHAYIVSSAASMILTALYPLAAHLMLNDSIKIDIKMPTDMLTDEFKHRTSAQTARTLHKIQSSFHSPLDISYEGVSEWEHFRLMQVRISIRTDVGVEEAIKMYEDIYDDHNFTHMVRRDVKAHECEGTQKCIIQVSSQEDGILQIDATADPRMRGGAGDAVHVMNLLFGLHEKTGLSLKSSWF